MDDLAFYTFILSLLAGLSTSVGGLIVVLAGKPKQSSLDFSMGLAAGVMLTVAFLNLVGRALDMDVGHAVVAVGFVIGAATIMVLDARIPHVFSFQEYGPARGRLVKTGMLMAIGVTLHNVPEGLVVAASYAYLPKLGYLVALAIAFHNVPEGIATAAPLCAAGTGKKRILAITLLSGLAEPLGALIGSFILIAPSQLILALMLAAAAGVMTYVTADELIPTAHAHGHEHAVAIGLIAGFSLMLLLAGYFEL